VRLAGLPVLVVDDNATNRRILTEMLERWHMRPTAVAGVPDAVYALQDAARRGRPFSLVLTDAHMPGEDGFRLVERIRNSRELDNPVVLMITSGEQRGDLARCRELGISVYLIKPIRRGELKTAIAAVLPEAGEPKPVDHPSLLALDSRVQSSQPFSIARILLAEDNIVNQRVAVRILEKAGHMVVVARSGSEALQALESQEFDVVFMDVQMPDMDGLEATAIIRRMEESTGKHLPIVAMTAHAMTGDRERCLASGMDGYLSKPIHAQDLLKLVNQYTAAPAEAEAGAPLYIP
jgi:CheY-like chemotaxis protein